ncbi:probable inactive dual specificity protein phosphatase-like At4g18593 [Benincasa hispida]|uniref:probable inactive dual specificity protein phosphatase-like At4g18593 n=1 Tax=Benincasa hispida TaxID=102211 RepID=UPI0018FFD43B|nr:probable inactive dual specificity protein phosphatase-like At4g18593 [Benincasa hispida]
MSHYCRDTNMADENNSSSESLSNTQVMYRCKKCRRIVATQESMVTHERGKGESCFKWNKRSGNSRGIENKPADCTSIFVEPMKWMETLQDGHDEEKLVCIGCKARLGSFNWAGMQCSCGAWVNPAFQLHKSRLDECLM